MFTALFLFKGGVQMLEAKKANATMHKGAGNPVRGMESAKTSEGKAHFSAGAKVGASHPLVTKQNGHKGDSKKVDRLYE